MSAKQAANLTHFDQFTQIWIELLLWNAVAFEWWERDNCGPEVTLANLLALVKVFPPGGEARQGKARRLWLWSVSTVAVARKRRRRRRSGTGRFHPTTTAQQQLEMANLIYNIFDSWPARSMQSSALFFFSFLHLLLLLLLYLFFGIFLFFLFYFLFRFCRLFKTFSLSFSICVFWGFALPPSRGQ